MTYINVEDYLPTGMSFVSSPDFSEDMGSYIAVIESLEAGNSIDLNITLSLDQFSGNDIINNKRLFFTKKLKKKFNQALWLESYANTASNCRKKLSTTNGRVARKIQQKLLKTIKTRMKQN